MISTVFSMRIITASRSPVGRFKASYPPTPNGKPDSTGRRSEKPPRLLSNSPSINLISPSCTGKVDRAKMIIVYDTEIQVLNTYLIISLTTRAHGGTPEWNPMIALGGTPKRCKKEPPGQEATRHPLVRTRDQINAETTDLMHGETSSSNGGTRGPPRPGMNEQTEKETS